MPMKKMYKVLAAVERNGQTFWSRMGVGFPNRDESINMLLDFLPVATKDGQVKLQLRELTDEDLARSQERKAQRGSEWMPRTGRVDANVNMELPVQMEAANANEIPF
ncbi:MAG: hypothetical protein QM831_15320 [Kofleriaceae bacterium]